MRLSELPSRWQDTVETYLKRPEAEYKEISVADFANHLRILFEDGSNANFLHSFYLVDGTASEIAIFTEHCGYHVFPFCVERIETTDRDGVILKSESFLVD